MKKQLLFFILLCASVAPVAQAGLVNWPRELCEHCGQFKALPVGQRFLYGLNENAPQILGASAGIAAVGGFGSWLRGKLKGQPATKADIAKAALAAGVVGSAAGTIGSFANTAWHTNPEKLKECALELGNQQKENIVLGISALAFMGAGTYLLDYIQKSRADAKFITWLRDKKESADVTRDVMIAQLAARWKDDNGLIGENQLLDQYMNDLHNRDKAIARIETFLKKA